MASGLAAPVVPGSGGRVLEYGVAALVGLLTVVLLVPIPTLLGTGGVFANPVGDLPTNLIGHLAFQAPGWRWPPFVAPDLAWPRGESIALTDSNPVLSLAAKLIAATVGHTVNLFGVWLALCLFLQPVGAAFALRGLLTEAAPRLNRIAAVVAGSVLVLWLPAFLFRAIHINLLGHFLLLAALGVALRHAGTAPPPRFSTLAALLTLTVFVHPYLFLFSSALLCAPALQKLWLRAEGGRAALRHIVLAAQMAAVLFLIANGGAAAGAAGFGLYSTNLLAPVWPQHSGLFGASLPVLDATGYQHEGFNYLGAGLVLLLAVAAAGVARLPRAARGAALRPYAGLALVLIGLTALAVTYRPTVGPFVLFPYYMPILERLFAVVRASGRAIWAVDYALILGALGFLAHRLSARLLLPLLAVIVALQWADTGPLRSDFARYLAGAGVPSASAGGWGGTRQGRYVAGDGAPTAVQIPAGTRLFRTVPLCGPEDVGADIPRLAALRAGAHLAQARLAHPQPDDVCAADLAAALSQPLEAGEARLFLPSFQKRVDPSRLRATCRPFPAGLLCAPAAPG